VAVKLILSHPDKYGFHLQPGDRYPPLAYDRVRIGSDRDLSLQLVARAAKTDFKTIKELNPELRGHFLPAGKHRILVPSGSGRDLDERLQALKQTRPGKTRERVYVVRKGDSLSAIAARFKVSLPALLLWNRLRLKDTIHPGDRLIIYPGKTSS
jgi:LysM repeat protein